jgi:hypothetical protein
MRTRLVQFPPIAAHQGGWDEILMIAAPISLFLLLRWLGLRKERREQAAEGTEDKKA